VVFPRSTHSIAKHQAEKADHELTNLEEILEGNMEESLKD
jgi:hypothetical protein